MIRPVGLDDETIRRLGSRPGSIEGPLANGQVSRRMLALHGVLTIVEQHHPELFRNARVQDSRRLLGQAQRTNRPATNDLIRTPAVGTWLMQCASDHANSSAEALAVGLGQLGALVAVACLRAGLPFDVVARTRADGTLMFPTLGRLVASDRSERIRLTDSDDAAIEVSVPNQELIVVRPDAPESSSWKPLRRLRSEANGLTIELVLDDLDPYRGHHLPPVAPRLGPDEVAHWQQLLDTAWDIITRQPEQALALRAGMRSLVPLQTDDRAPFVSATTRDAVGAAGVTCRTGGALAEAVVHEYQHSVLWSLLDVVDLVKDDPTPSYYAPWRSDPRPARGLLHGAFAFHGLLRYWADRAANDADRVAAFELALWRIGVRTVVAQMSDSALLTAPGSILLDGMRATLDEMGEHPVPEDVRRLAEDIALDLWTTWRLRNRRPARAEVEACCAAWRAAAARPPVGGWTMVDEEHRVAGTPRLALIRRMLAESDRFAEGAAPGDVRWADGDWDSAATLYAAALQEADDTPATWSGAILAWKSAGRPDARSLLEHPEHARAAFTCITRCTGRSPDLTQFAAWFSEPHSER